MLMAGRAGCRGGRSHTWRVGDTAVDVELGGERLHEWLVATRTFRLMDGGEGGDEGLDDQFAARGDAGIGATIMGRNMLGPIRGPWGDEQWSGWWGDHPPFRHRVFVLTHHPPVRPSRCGAGPRSTSSAAASRRPCSERSKPPTAAT
jgi:dihydrofolate reductase